MMKLWLAILLTFSSSQSHAEQSAPEDRIATIMISQNFINEQIKSHSKGKIFRDLSVSFNTENGEILARGLLQVPIEELRAVNLDPSLGAFRFQVTIHPEATDDGYLVLEFPLSETYFYPATAKDVPRERVIVPVQMLSLGLASIRGYLAALSGDFSGFNRRTLKIKAEIKALDMLIHSEKNADDMGEFKNQKAALKLQLEAVPIERKQLEYLSKELSQVLGFTGEKEINLNDELGARKNALIFKIKLSQLVPYLKGIELSGVRLVRSKMESGAPAYLAIDVSSELAEPVPKNNSPKPANKPPSKTPPAMVIRLNQALLESTSVVSAEKSKAPSKLRDLDIQMHEDGMHVTGKWHTFFMNLPFDTIVDFVSTAPDVFEVRVRDLDVAGIDLQFLTKYVLEAIKARFELTMKDIYTFEYVGEVSDHSKALRITVNAAKMIPAFPDLHLIDVDVREREFLLKLGRL